MTECDHNLGSLAGSYLGLDLSLTSTGLAYLDGDGLKTWRFLPPRQLGLGPARLVWLRDTLGHALDLHRPDMVVVENYAYESKHSTHQTGEWGGLARVVLYERGAWWFLVPPSTAKKFVTGRGDSEKSTVPMWLHKRWGVWVENGDEADATGLAIMGAYRAEAHLEPTKAQAEAMAKMEAGARAARVRVRPFQPLKKSA